MVSPASGLFAMAAGAGAVVGARVSGSGLMNNISGDQLNEFARRLHPTSAVYAAPDRLVTGRGQGVVVMTFNGFSVDNARNIRLPDTYGDSSLRRMRGAIGGLWNGIDKIRSYTRLREMQFTYWRRTSPAQMASPPRLSQQKQLGPLLGAIDAWNGPTIFGGDFNK